jgi:hypothetical protein
MTTPENDTSEDNGSGAKIAGAVAVFSMLTCVTAPLVLAGGAILVIMMGICQTILLPLVLLMQLFGLLGGGGGGSNTSADQIIAAYQGDGKGALDSTQVPLTSAVDAINAAGALCTTISPVIVAAQIEHESDFDSTKKGPNGAEGLSQLPPDVFTKYGKDDDKNGNTSALDDTDSIMAQGRYLCDLAGQVQTLVNERKAIGDVLDLTLAAYHVGIDAIRTAGGIPPNAEVHSYIVEIRVLFPKYQGIAPP